MEREAIYYSIKRNMALVLHKFVDLKTIFQRDEKSISYPFV